VEREGGSFSLSFDLRLVHSLRCFIARASLPSRHRHRPPSLSVSLSLTLVFVVSNTTGIVVTMVQLTQRNKVIAYVVAMQSPCCWLSDSRNHPSTTASWCLALASHLDFCCRSSRVPCSTTTGTRSSEVRVALARTLRHSHSSSHVADATTASTYILAPLPLMLGGILAQRDPFGHNEGRGFLDMGIFLSTFFIVSGLLLPMVLAHNDVVRVASALGEDALLGGSSLTRRLHRHHTDRSLGHGHVADWHQHRLHDDRRTSLIPLAPALALIRPRLTCAPLRRASSLHTPELPVSVPQPFGGVLVLIQHVPRPSVAAPQRLLASCVCSVSCSLAPSLASAPLSIHLSVCLSWLSLPILYVKSTTLSFVRRTRSLRALNKSFDCHFSLNNTRDSIRFDCRGIFTLFVLLLLRATSQE